ncbi:anti-repressor SinI family protein [Paucisalibacillus sp. EB02]|nr:anti-repressor SinI family protein [Paucisalibacillus sp. EB02]
MIEKQSIHIQTLEPIELDVEWIKLILEAKRVGISLDEIRDFIERNTIR